jgi:hypothetical protein
MDKTQEAVVEETVKMLIADPKPCAVYDAATAKFCALKKGHDGPHKLMYIGG